MENGKLSCIYMSFLSLNVSLSLSHSFIPRMALLSVQNSSASSFSYISRSLNFHIIISQNKKKKKKFNSRTLHAILGIKKEGKTFFQPRFFIALIASLSLSIFCMHNISLRCDAVQCYKNARNFFFFLNFKN